MIPYGSHDIISPQRAVPKAFDKQMSNIQAKVLYILYSIDLVQDVFQIEAKEEAIIEAQQELKAIKKEAKSNSGMAK